MDRARAETIGECAVDRATRIELDVARRKIEGMRVASRNDHPDQEIWWRRWDLNPRTS
jgi:hypothetical protein